MAREGLDETESDCYGMFATTNIRRGETILREGKVICGAGLIPRDSLPAGREMGRPLLRERENLNALPALGTGFQIDASRKTLSKP